MKSIVFIFASFLVSLLVMGVVFPDLLIYHRLGFYKGHASLSVAEPFCRTRHIVLDAGLILGEVFLEKHGAMEWIKS